MMLFTRIAAILALVLFLAAAVFYDSQYSDSLAVGFVIASLVVSAIVAIRGAQHATM